MRLILTLAAEDQPPPGKAESRSIDENGITIGRGAENDWVLPDPQRHLSKRHCRITFADGRYTITDTSTNGVFLNRSPVPIGRGRSEMLHDGDRIEIGDYALQVRITAVAERTPRTAAPGQRDPQPAAVPSGPAPAPPTDLVDDLDPFGIDEKNRTDPPPGASPGPDPLFEPPPRPSSRFDAPPGPDPLFDAPPPLRTDRPAGAEGFEPPVRNLADPYDDLPSRLPPTPAGDGRPAATRPPAPPAAESGGGLGPLGRLGDDRDILGRAHHEPWPGQDQRRDVAADPDHVPAEQGFFRPPDVVRTQPPDEIPEDWYADLGLPAPQSGRRPEAPPPFESRSTPPPLPPDPLGDRPSLLQRDLLADRPPLPLSRDGREPPPQREPAAPPFRAAASPSPPLGSDDPLLLRAFLEGAGVGDLHIPEEEMALVMHSVGMLFREMVGGLRDILTARSSMKAEFGVERTMIGALNNNPLKPATNLDLNDSVSALIHPPPRGFQPPLHAVQEGVRDLKAHQMATLAGMQVALTALLRQFDPEALKQKLDKSSLLDSILPSAKKAKYWEIYEQMYKRIAAEAEESFHGLYRSEFARAYRDQVDKL